MVDKNLFLYDLAVVAIMKNEEPYVKEWLDYHLLAGVDHFYIYDNDSTPEFKKILQPYIDAGIVTYTFFGGKCRQMEAYNDAVKRFRFCCRYLAVIDGDEFIFPKSKSTITEVVDEILSKNPNAGGLAVNWIFFGSNNQENADYSRGVLERFTKRAANPHPTVKTAVNPRRVNYYPTPHAPAYYEPCFAVNEKGGFVAGYSNPEPSVEKIVMVHYHSKSFEEYERKVQRGNADFVDNKYSIKNFSHNHNNDEFDDGILKYREARCNALIPSGGGAENLFHLKQINYGRLFNALVQNLFPLLNKGLAPVFFNGKLENFLTCLNLIPHLRGKVLDDKGAKFFEELSLEAIHKSLYAALTLADIFLLIDEMPKILVMDYPVVNQIREALMRIIQQVMLLFRMNNHWQGFTDLDHELKILQSFDTLTKRTN